jgi:hypothetical protein
MTQKRNELAHDKLSSKKSIDSEESQLTRLVMTSPFLNLAFVSAT